MASGKLGSAALAANTNSTVYTVPASTVATLNVAIVNRGDAAAVVNISIGTTTTPGNADYVEFGVSVPAKGVLERTALVAGAGERVIVRSSTPDCSVRVHGFEEGV